MKLGPEDGSQQHRRKNIGEQNQSDRPGRPEALVGDEQQRNVRRPRADRRLREREEEDPRSAFLPEKIENWAHQCVVTEPGRLAARP